MRFYPADPDISTIYNRIEQGDINLQPDFQRGEVWSLAKRQRLIDSILRNWIVPPILVVSAKNGETQEVLDGQQRLAAIRDFKNNKILVDGRIEPKAPEIEALHGQTYDQLPIDVKRAFDRTTIRIFEVRDYKPEEPAEIFFRLNQPTPLTSAEKRNAFYGPVRTQIRDLVELLLTEPRATKLLGFSNSRMAYDDVISRLACTLEFGTLHKKVTAGAITEMYRRQVPLDDEVFFRTRDALQRFAAVVERANHVPTAASQEVRLNKATALSWMLFICRLDATGDLGRVSEFLVHFETIREAIGPGNEVPERRDQNSIVPLPTRGAALLLYNDRASSRVGDVSSVLIRDIVLWLSWYEFSRGISAGSFEPGYRELSQLAKQISSISALEAEILRFADKTHWGGNL